ncbi:MAG: response regulator transcription factor [Clostridia bacterium]|nr:response regulator transcription factor [Clostridia bacterium]
MVRVLVVEDDERLNQIVCSGIQAAGYEAQGCVNAQEAFDCLYSGGIDMIVSDIMMPGMDGIEMVDNIRRINKTIPILLMTARDDFASKRRGFRAGIDDYMVKPIDVDELILRIEALLRRARIEAEKRLTVGRTVLDAEEMCAYVDGEEISLTVREFNILYKLLSYPKRTFSRAQLMDEFWSGESSASLRAVDVYITRIRDKFSDCEDFKIVTVHGLGYKAVLSV